MANQKNTDDLKRRREKGQFWTPEWVAEAMVAYVSKAKGVVFDPGVGRGAFYSALKKIAPERKFFGTDIDPEVIAQAKEDRIFGQGVKLEIRDFILEPPKGLFNAIVANPPYVRHHHITKKQKDHFNTICQSTIGDRLDGRAGLHIYFLIQALNLLARSGRLAFIMPADTCEGIFATKLWNWISKKFRIDGIITFDHKATPFPGVDTNAVIFLLRNSKPREKFIWAKCTVPNNKELFTFLKGDLVRKNYKGIEIKTRNLNEALSTGLTRAPRQIQDNEFKLADFAYVMRGIATGANEFFFLTRKQAEELGIPPDFLLPAIGRTRDAEGLYLSKKTLNELEKKGRPTLLFSPNGLQWEDMPLQVKKYIVQGERLGLAKRALISTRRPWYRMEIRRVPVFLFAYLGRRNARFIKNEAGVVPLTGFLCVYPHSADRRYIDKLWEILQHPDTISNLQLVGKSYGSGAIKVEPRSLERLPIPSRIVKRLKLHPG